MWPANLTYCTLLKQTEAFFLSDLIERDLFKNYVMSGNLKLSNLI